MNKEKQQTPVIDSYRCNGCGSCAELCPQVFIMDEIMETAAVAENPPTPLPECVHEAVAWCPTSCIEIDD